MSDCSACKRIFAGTTDGQRIRAPYLVAALAFLLMSLLVGLPARASAGPVALAPTPTADPTPPPCVDGDSDGFVHCDGVCDPGGHACDIDDSDGRIYPGAPCGLCNGNCPISGFCVPGSTNLPCPDPTNGTLGRDDTHSFCMNVNSKVIGICSNSSAHCFTNADCPGGTCNSAVTATGNGLTANADGSNPVCAAIDHPIIWQAEGGTALTPEQRRVEPTCLDNTDNDCDGLPDVLDPDCQSPEICDNKDNNGNGLIDEGLGVGDPCSVGVGACQASGVKVCKGDGTTATVCNAVAKAPQPEGPFGDPSCSDGIDNNCDGKTDFPNPITNPNGDPGCTKPEVCDGLDNDGDGVIDNGFPDLGQPCSLGTGACAATGVKVCSADGKGTVCNAVPHTASIEGPSVPGSCSDGIDNDCDGLIDKDDPSCGTVGLRITCALPFEVPSPGGRGSPGKDCNSFQKIVFDQPDGVTVTAELLALNQQGAVVASMPVKNGEFAHLASRIGADDFRFDTVTAGSGNVTHTVFAPMPMLKVTATDGVRNATAYCTTDPFLDVVKPSGGVVSVNKSAQSTPLNSTPVIVAIPEVSPASLAVKVDGLDIFTALGKTGADCTVASPCVGDVTIGGTLVHITDLIVDVAPTLDVLASNTLSMSLDGLGCGGHVVSVSGRKIPGSLPDKVTSQCFVDDLADKGTSYIFTVDITSPVNQSNNNPVPTHVAGKVCHGLPIQAVTINGKDIFDPSQMTITPNPPPPPGADTAAKFEFPISTDVGQTSLARDIVFGDAPVGTFDPGSNFLQAAATDAMGNRVFNNSVVFATGDHVVNPGQGPLAATTSAFSGAMDPQVKATIEKEVGASILDAVRDISIKSGSTIDVPNAFVVALDATALSNFFAQKCSAPGTDGKTITQRFQEAANKNILGRTFPPPDKDPFHAPSLCSCDPPFRLTVTHVDFLTNLGCPVFFPGQVDSFGGTCSNDPDPDKTCRTDADCGGATCNRPPVPDDTIRVVLELPDISAGLAGGGWCKETFLGVCIDEASVSITLNAEVHNVRLKFDITEAQLMGTVPPGAPKFTGGIAATIEPSVMASMHVGCIGGDICKFVVSTLLPGIGSLLVQPHISFDQTFDLTHQLGQFKQDPIELHPIKLDEEKIANFGQTVKGNLVDVNISPQGIRASLTGKFSTDHVDPDVVANPGQFLEFPPTPELPIASGQDGAVMVNADSINMMFASLTLSGHMKSECNPSIDPMTHLPRTVGSLLPDDCNSINPPSAGAAALARGFCFGLKGANCETLAAPGNFLNTAIEQGTCHGMENDNCSTITSGFAGIKMPADCTTLSIGASDSADPNRATDIVQGWCAGLKSPAIDCETLTGGTDADVAAKQGACHGAQTPPPNCTAIPTGANPGQEIGACAAIENVACSGLGIAGNIQCGFDKIEVNIINNLVRIAEQGACNLTPNINVHANDTLLFCARQDLPPHFVIRDDASTPPVEVGLRLNDLSVAVVLDRSGPTPGSPPNGQLDGSLASTPPCFGQSAVASGDCSLAALCLDLNFKASFELAGGDCPLDPSGLSKPGFKVKLEGVQPLQRVFGQVCGGSSGGDDSKVVSESTTNNASIDQLQLNSTTFSPPACMSGLTLGGFVTFENPKIFALATGAPKSVCSNDPNIVCTSDAGCGGNQCVPIQNYIGISTKILP